MQFRRAIAALAAVGGLACMRTPPDFVVAPTFTIDETHALEWAAHDWNLVTIDQITLNGGEWHILRADPPVHDGRVGQTDGRFDLVWIKPNLPPVLFLMTAKHELGHALGLGHVCHGIMAGTAPPPRLPCLTMTWTPDITDEDMIECRYVGACAP